MDADCFWLQHITGCPFRKRFSHTNRLLSRNSLLIVEYTDIFPLFWFSSRNPGGNALPGLPDPGGGVKGGGAVWCRDLHRLMRQFLLQDLKAYFKHRLYQRTSPGSKTCKVGSVAWSLEYSNSSVFELHMLMPLFPSSRSQGIYFRHVRQPTILS